MDNLLLLEARLEDTLKQGANELKIAYFNFGIYVEENAKNIGIYQISFNRDLIQINNRPLKENIIIRENDLLNVYPEIEYKQALKLFANYAAIYNSSFFDHMRKPYDSFIGLYFIDNQVKFESINFSLEFMKYKTNNKKEELENELSINQNIQEKRIKL